MKPCWIIKQNKRFKNFPTLFEFKKCGMSPVLKTVQKPPSLHSAESSHLARLWLARFRTFMSVKETNLIWRCRYLWPASSWPYRQHLTPHTGEEGSHTAPGPGTLQCFLCRRCPSVCMGWRRRLLLQCRCRYGPSQTCPNNRKSDILLTYCIL